MIIRATCYQENPLSSLSTLGRRGPCPLGPPLSRRCGAVHGEASWVMHTCTPTPPAAGLPCGRAFHQQGSETAAQREGEEGASHVEAEQPGKRCSLAGNFRVAYHLEMIIVFNPGLVPVA